MRRSSAALLGLLLAVGCATTRVPNPNALPPEATAGGQAAAAGTAAVAPGGKGARKVYSVAELSGLLEANPRSLLNQPFQLRARVVGGVGGEGCSDFLMLIDPENVATYQKLFDPTASNAEFEHARAVPFLMAGPAREFPNDVIEMNAGVFVGKFFSCEGALRFRIERAEAAETTARLRPN